MNNETIIKSSALVGGGLVVGGIGGYYFAKRRLTNRYEEQIQEEIESIKQAYQRINRKDDYATPAEAVKALVVEPGPGADEVESTEEERGEYNDAIRDMEYGLESVTTVETVSIFHKEVVTEEQALRDPTIPYLISYEEFMEDDEFEKVNLSYFEGDDVLMDEQERTVPDVEGTVGSENLNRFGERSQDKSMVYIRNERLRTDFEVVREEGSYAVVVLGMQPQELEPHSRTRPKRPRDERDD